MKWAAVALTKLGPVNAVAVTWQRQSLEFPIVEGEDYEIG